MDTTTTDAVLDRLRALAESWIPEQHDRFQRRSLDPDDFAAVAETGFCRLVVPESHGGLWRSAAETGPILVEAIQRIAAGDQSVGLVASMHPSVQIFWAASPDADEPFAQAWAEQRAEVFGTAMDGHFWGTIASEPGSGGDIMRTKATAKPIDGSPDRFMVSGDKHFGSGSGIVSYMVTTAKPEDTELPMGFVLDLRDQPWDGSAGLTITRAWDGMGMKATQSHAVRLNDLEATAWAWPGALAASAPVVGGVGVAMFCAVIAAVVDEAMAEAERRLGGRQLRSYEEVAWTQAQIDHWMFTQARQGLVRTIAEASPTETLVAATKAKLGMASAAESLLGTVSRAVGGGAFSASSPFATWYEDVRALGYLRPPWALAFDQLAEIRQSE